MTVPACPASGFWKRLALMVTAVFSADKVLHHTENIKKARSLVLELKAEWEKKRTVFNFFFDFTASSTLLAHPSGHCLLLVLQAGW